MMSADTIKLPAIKKACPHTSMAFCVVNNAVYIRCLSCRALANMRLDKQCSFTDEHARFALNKLPLDDRDQTEVA